MATRALVCILILGVLIASSALADVPGEQPAINLQLPAISGHSAALFDLDSGAILGGHNLEERVFPASTTKVLTAYLALERANLDDVVTISQVAQNQTGTSLYSRVGHTYTLEELLYASLVLSANDAAVAIAEHVAGSVAAFSDLMNEFAQQVGATDTHFVNPSGLPDNDHYTTARDMALIFTACMRNDTLRDMMATRSYILPLVTGERRYMVNGNNLLTSYSGTIAGKTGYTAAAGNTIVTAVERGNLRLGVAVFRAAGGGNLWADATALLDSGFAQLQRRPIVVPNQTVTSLSVLYGKEALLVAGDELTLLLERGQQAWLQSELRLERPIRAPLAAHESVGWVDYYVGERHIGSVPLKVAHDVPRIWYTYWEGLVGLLVLGAAWRGRKHLTYGKHI